MSSLKLDKDLESLKKNFGLTEEEIVGYLEFFKNELKSKRIINSGSKKNGFTKISSK